MKLAIIIALFILLAVPAYAQVPTAPFLRVSLINQDPDPSEAGSFVDVRFKVENIGSTTARDIEFDIQPSPPFKLSAGDSAIKNLGSISGQQTGDEGVIVKYRLLVDVEAPEGDIEINPRIKYQGNDWISYKGFNVSLKPALAILTISDVTANPDTIQPGGTSKVTLHLQNDATSLLKDIRVKLDLSSATLPLAPISGSSEKTIPNLAGGATSTVEFELMAEPDASAGVYKLPIELRFRDILNKNFTKEEIAGIVIGSEPEISATIDSSEIVSPGQSGEIIVKFVNRGLTDVKFFNVALLESDNFQILGSEEVYIGKIDSDDFETIEYKLYVKPGSTDVKLPFVFEYRDANNKFFSESRDVQLKLFSDEEAKQFGLKQTSSTMGILIIIVIVVVGVFAYRWFRKRK